MGAALSFQTILVGGRDLAKPAETRRRLGRQAAVTSAA
jgi:hypothetical protein